MSKEAFREWFQIEVGQRWPKCWFSWTEMGDWHWRLGDFDAARLTEAVRRHKVQDEPSRPSLKAVYRCVCQQTAGQTPNAKKERDVPDAHTFIMCTGKDMDGCGCVGRIVPIHIVPLHREYSRKTFRQVAERQAKAYAQSSGGVWEVFCDTDDRQMNDRRHTLLNLSLPAAAATWFKRYL